MNPPSLKHCDSVNNLSYRHFFYDRNGFVLPSEGCPTFVINRNGTVSPETHLVIRRYTQVSSLAGIAVKVIYGNNSPTPYTSAPIFDTEGDVQTGKGLFMRDSNEHPLYNPCLDLLGSATLRIISLPDYGDDVFQSIMAEELTKALSSALPTRPVVLQSALEGRLSSVPVDAGDSYAPMQPTAAAVSQSDVTTTVPDVSIASLVQRVFEARDAALESLEGQRVVKAREAAKLLAAVLRAAPESVHQRLFENTRGADGFVHADGAKGISVHRTHKRRGSSDSSTPVEWTREKILAATEMLIRMIDPH